MFNLLLNLKNWHVLGILIAVAVLSAVFSASARGGTLDAAWWADLWQGLTTEMFGAGATFLLIEVFLERRKRREDKEEAIQERKAVLIRQMGSRVNEEAIRAVEELRAHRWLFDGSLQGADLGLANLQGANLERAELQGASFWGANLQGVGLFHANLNGAVLIHANLQGAALWGADLQGAVLIHVNLQGANFWMANLQEASFTEAKFDENTTLPDNSKWTPEADLTRFTDPAHPHFWRLDNPDSPAYRGKGEE